MHNNEISTWDRDSSEEEAKEKMYDASLESKERTQPQKEIKNTKKNLELKTKTPNPLEGKSQPQSLKTKRIISQGLMLQTISKKKSMTYTN